MDSRENLTGEPGMGLRIGFAAIAICLAGTAQAQTTVSNDDQATIRLLVQQVHELQAKVTALEATQPSPSTATAQPGAVAAASQTPQYEPAKLNRALDQIHEVRGMQWRGFGEANYQALNQRLPEFDGFGFVPGSAGNFYTGDLDLLITSRITDKASFLGELVIGEGDAQSFHVSMDRLLLKYDWNEHRRNYRLAVITLRSATITALSMREMAANFGRPPLRDAIR
jgi:hypothetical protein